MPHAIATRPYDLQNADSFALSLLSMEPVSLGRVVPMIQAQAVEYLLNEVGRSRLRPMVATFIPQLASVRSGLYTQHLIEERREN